jgi:hypothetical protein
MIPRDTVITIVVVAVVVCVNVALFYVLSRIQKARRAKTRAAPRPATAAAAPEPQADLFAAGSPADKRQAVRRKGKFIPVQIVEPEGRRSPIEGWVVDRSVSGVRLGVGRQIPVGTKIKICVVGVSPPVWIEVEVTNCTKGKPDWFVGGKFLGAPTSKDLWTLG